MHPLRGKRPPNRRALILDAAADLFYERGYDAVGMSEIAEAVGIGTSALYRHFPGKQQLLADAVLGPLRPIRDLVLELGLSDIGAAVRSLCALALEKRRVGVLWQREARHLADRDRSELRDGIAVIGRHLGDMIVAGRPTVSAEVGELLTHSVLAVVTSPSFHHLELPRLEYEWLLADLTHRVIDAPVGHLTITPTPNPGRLLPGSRREALLIEAIRLFAQRGYNGVSIEDIGASLGIAGPSVYNHFLNKLELLETAISRGTALLMAGLAEALGAGGGPGNALRGLIDSYAHFATAHGDLVTILITEIHELPQASEQEARRTQRDYLSEWVRLIQMLEPHSDPTVARIKVRAAVTVINDTSRTRLSSADGYPEAIRIAAAHLLCDRPEQIVASTGL